MLQQSRHHCPEQQQQRQPHRQEEEFHHRKEAGEQPLGCSHHFENVAGSEGQKMPERRKRPPA